MSKVYESDIDPDEFIRSFREEPSQLPKPKLEKEFKEQNEDRNKDNPISKPKSKKSKSEPCSEEEERYLELFVRNMEHVRPLCKYLMVDIHPDFIKKIKRVLSYESGQVCSTKAYINNVLAEHFRQYENFIEKRQ